MAKGPSGRMVVEIDPPLKQTLHAALAADGLTFKEWLIGQADAYLENRRQPQLPGLDVSLPLAAEDRSAYAKTAAKKATP